jgi:hypothetical protein
MHKARTFPSVEGGIHAPKAVTVILSGKPNQPNLKDLHFQVPVTTTPAYRPPLRRGEYMECLIFFKSVILTLPMANTCSPLRKRVMLQFPLSRGLGGMRAVMLKGLVESSLVKKIPASAGMTNIFFVLMDFSHSFISSLFHSFTCSKHHHRVWLIPFRWVVG